MQKRKVGILTFSDGRKFAHDLQYTMNKGFQDKLVKVLEATGEIECVPSEIVWTPELARSEAKKSFGDETILVEKYIERGRHIEVQIVGDQHGTVWALGGDRLLHWDGDTWKLASVPGSLPDGGAVAGELISEHYWRVMNRIAEWPWTLLHQDYRWRVTNIFDTRVAAQLLGINRNTLRKKIRDLDAAERHYEHAHAQDPDAVGPLAAVFDAVLVVQCGFCVDGHGIQPA